MAKNGQAGNRQAKNKASHKAHVAKSSGSNTSAFKRGNASTNPDRVKGKGQTHMRSKATINRLNMYRSKPNEAKMKAAPKVPMVRIQPDRRWFGNTRVLTQNKLQEFREEMSKSVDDPFNVVLKASKLPMSLLKDSDKEGKMKLLQVESFEQTFGPKKLRKKPKLAVDDLSALADRAESNTDKYAEDKDGQRVEYREHERSTAEDKTLVSEYVFQKGTSKRIWAELYKVIDSSDVVIEVIDARDPMGTRNVNFERELRKNHPHKKLVLLLNKCDLIPAWAASRWTKSLNKEYPTVAFHASVTNPFGKAALIQLLRQFAMLLKQRQHVQIGLVGYPNVGKSSVINALKMKKVCKAAPIPGETKVWQYVSLTKKIFLIDCPGIVPPTDKDFSADSAKVLKGVVRAERIEFPSNYIPEVLTRVKHKYLLQRYKLPSDTEPWEDHEEFLKVLALKMGKLRKGGEPDIEIVARMILYDWQRGRLPFFTPPPAKEADEEDEKEEAGEEEEAKENYRRPGQSFQQLKCVADYDEDDAAREVVEDIEAEGEAVVASDDEDKEEADKPAKPLASEKPTRKRKRAAAAEEDAAEVPRAKKRGAEDRAAGDAEQARKKKRAKKDAAKAKAAAVTPSQALDWGAVADEFAA
jgi:nuclear GTP-binding protein